MDSTEKKKDSGQSEISNSENIKKHGLKLGLIIRTNSYMTLYQHATSCRRLTKAFTGNQECNFIFLVVSSSAICLWLSLIFNL